MIGSVSSFLLPFAKSIIEKAIAKIPDIGLLCVTSSDRLYAEWSASRQALCPDKEEMISHVEVLLAPLARQAALVTVLDGYPLTLSWLGGVRGQKTESLGTEHFGQSGNFGYNFKFIII